MRACLSQNNSDSNCGPYATFTGLQIVTSPREVLNLRVTDVSNDLTDVLAWDAPTDNGGAAITGYKVARRVIGQTGFETAVDTGSTATTHSYSKMSSSVGYDYEVRAVNSEGEGPLAPRISVAGRPSGLGTLMATRDENRVAIMLSWSAPSNNGGKDITQYMVQWREDSANDWNMNGAAGTRFVTSGTSVTIDTLDPATTYNFRYRADNADRVSFFNVNDGSVEATTIDQATASVADAAAEEGDAVSFTVTLSSTRTSNVTLNWATSDGAATAPADYTAQASGTVTVTAGQTTATFTVQTAEDGLDEDDETFTVTLSNPPATVAVGDATATGTIRDDDDPPVLSVNSPSVLEGDSGTETALTFVVELSPASGRRVRVGFNTATQAVGTANAATERPLTGTPRAPEHDYHAYNAQLDFAPGDTLKTVRVTVYGDDVTEPDETVQVVFGGVVEGEATFAPGLQVQNPNNPVSQLVFGTILNDDSDAPMVSVADAEATEGAPATFTVSLSETVAQPVTVNWATSSATGDRAATADSDYTAANGSVTIPANAGSATFAVETLEDVVYEHPETFTVTLSAPSGGLPDTPQGRVRLAADPTATGTIADDDPLPVLTAGTNGVTEGDSGTSHMIFNLRLEPESGLNQEVNGRGVTVDWRTEDGTAKAPGDYEARSGTATFAPGERLKTVGVPIAGDVLVESDETVYLALSNLSGATFRSSLDAMGGTARVSGTITDDDDAPNAIEMDASPRTVREDADPTTVAVTASFPSGTALSTDTSVAVDIGARSNDAIDATRGTDYAAPENLTVTIPAGRTTGTAEFELTPINDGAVERAYEQIVLHGTVPEEYGTLSLFVRMFLADDDAATTLALHPSEIVEGEAATVTATLNRAVAGETTLTVSAVPETGTDANDFTLDGTTLTIPEGQTSSTGTVTVTANQDSDEDHERVRISATASGGGTGTVAAPATVTLSIRDDDVTNVAATGAPTISGTAQAGQTLRASSGTIADADGLTGAVYTWQWIRVESDATEADIAGADEVTYAVADADVARTLKVRASFRDDFGNPESRTSAATAVVTAAPDPDDDDDGGDEGGDDEGDGGDDSGSSGGGGGGGGGGSSNGAPQTAQSIAAATVTASGSLEIDLSTAFSDPDNDDLTYEAESSDESVATVSVDGSTLTVRGVGAGTATITVTATDPDDESVSQTFTVTVEAARAEPATTHDLGTAVWLFASASDPMRQGFARVLNHSDASGTATVTATDDAGRTYEPLTLTLGPRQTAPFNSDDLESGNAAKGLAGGTGPGTGGWRFEVESDTLDVEALGYLRTSDGFVTAVVATAPADEDGTRHVAIFNPASNVNQVSHLRLVNPHDEEVEATVAGVDDAGRSPGSAVELTVPAGSACTVDAAELESGSGLDCGSPQAGLGDGAGKWRLAVESDPPLVAMSLLSSPTGHLTNLSGVASADADGVWHAHLFPAASDPLGRQGFMRVRNLSDEAGTVTITARDDTDREYETLTLSLAAGQTRHFNSDDLELGNAAKGLTGSTGAGTGTWRLALSSDDVEFEANAYIRTSEGFLTAMNASAPTADGVHRVAIFNPGSNRNQVSILRLVNPGTRTAVATVAGTDDGGARPGTTVRVLVPAGDAVELTAAELESGDAAAITAGALGDGKGKWRLRIEANRDIVAMSLLSSPTGHLTNLSRADPTRVD